MVNERAMRSPQLSPASESSQLFRFRATKASTPDLDADCESCVAPDSPNLSNRSFDHQIFPFFFFAVLSGNISGTLQGGLKGLLRFSSKQQQQQQQQHKVAIDRAFKANGKNAFLGEDKQCTKLLVLLAY